MAIKARYMHVFSIVEAVARPTEGRVPALRRCNKAHRPPRRARKPGLSNIHALARNLRD
jgi:hypothetical protein